MTKLPLPPKLAPAALIRKLLLAWLAAVTLEYFLLPVTLRPLGSTTGLGRMSLLRVLVCTVTGFLALWGLARIPHLPRIERWLMVAFFALLSAAALQASFTWAFLCILLLILAHLCWFAVKGRSRRRSPAPGQPARVCLWITVALTAAFFLLVSAWGVGRVLSFSSPSYDFGIFSQMFHSMKETGIPNTTLERDGLLSHFAVHLSPIYYLMLPFYCIYPHPVTLQVLQAAVLASAVIPLWKLGTHHGLTGIQRLLVCALLLLYPAYAGGTGYDLHENCFLTPLLLWLFYGIDRKKPAIFVPAALLTLLVKEDAAVYVAVIALWLLVKNLLSRQPIHTPLLLLAAALAWFGIATGYLSRYGDGVMTYRYQNFMYNGSDSLMAVVCSVILCPMKALYECVDPEKLHFLLLTLLPLLGLPLLTRRYERFLLLIPWVLVNLMSDYTYQHDIFFQYTFGSSAFLLYLTLVNLADLKESRVQLLTITAAVSASALLFAAAVMPTALRYPVQAYEYRHYYGNVRSTLALIPPDASVTAATFYTTQLSQRPVLYDIRYTTRAHLLETEYVVLQLSTTSDFQKFASSKKENGLENLIRFLESSGYTLWTSLEDVLLIYHKPDI